MLRDALRQVVVEKPFVIVAAVILPDHLHFLWSLPTGDIAYPERLGRMKASFTRLFHGVGALPDHVSASRKKHRESDVWQRR
jgi:putative transposase